MATPQTPAASAAAAETKAAKFSRLAPGRVERALDSIAKISQLASKNNYEWTEPQIAQIENAIRAELEVMGKRFRATGPVTTSGFKFSA